MFELFMWLLFISFRNVDYLGHKLPVACALFWQMGTAYPYKVLYLLIPNA